MMKQNEEFLTEKDCQEMARVMERRYAGEIADRYFLTEATRDEFGVYVKVTLRNDSGSFVYPVEARTKHQAHEMNHRDAGLFLLDFVDAYFEEYFGEGGEVFLPIDWADYECEDVALQLKGQILNLKIEKMADDLLASSGNDTTVH